MRYIRWAFLLPVITSVLMAAASIAVPIPVSATVNAPATPPAPVPRILAGSGLIVVAARTPTVVTARAPRTWVVRSGQTLSTIAAAAYGNSKLWPALWWVNKSRVPNPDYIRPGQVLRLSSWHPQAAWLYTAGKKADGPVRAVRPARLSAPHRAVSGRIWKVTYGYPYRCGDGDGDGWDRPCTALHRHRAAPHRRSFRRAAAVTGGSHYSFAGLERLWISAGGPAWAAARAARIAMCESGGNVYAHNGSGATGIFQILGQVVPGNLYNPYVNALNAVAKFRSGGNSFSAWVCR